MASNHCLNGIDSGYMSQDPAESSLGSIRCTTESPILLKKRIFRREIKLKRFDMPISEDIRDRFRDLKKLFDKPLYDHLSKSGHRPAPIAITLQYLGADESTAKPWIVVLCDRDVSKKVRQWFNTDPVKSYCCPQDSDSDTPKLEVIVHERAPRLLSEEVYGVGQLGRDSNDFTMCGRLLRIDDPSDGRVATLGGLLKISWESRFTICGITVHHVFHDSIHTIFETETSRDMSSSEILPSPSDASGDSDGDNQLSDLDDLDDDVFELEVMSDADSASIQRSSEPPLVTRVGFQYTSKIDTVRTNPKHASPQTQSVDLTRDRRLDWELISIEDTSKLWPNLLCNANGSYELKIEGLNSPAGFGKDVYVMSGLSGQKRGTISNVPSFLALLDPNRLIETYVLSLDDGTVLQRGDSGSWVVDANTYEVYGQVVASDVLRNIYIVPFEGIIREIKQNFGAKRVEFPTHDDLDFCTFFKPDSTQSEQKQEHISVEDALGQYELSKLDAYLAGEVEVEGVIPRTAAGSFTSVARRGGGKSLPTRLVKTDNDGKPDRAKSLKPQPRTVLRLPQDQLDPVNASEDGNEDTASSDSELDTIFDSGLRDPRTEGPASSLGGSVSSALQSKKRRMINVRGKRATRYHLSDETVFVPARSQRRPSSVMLMPAPSAAGQVHKEGMAFYQSLAAGVVDPDPRSKPPQDAEGSVPGTD